MEKARKSANDKVTSPESTHSHQAKFFHSLGHQEACLPDLLPLTSKVN